MTKVDFAVAFFVVIVIFVYSVVFISANMRNDFNQFSSMKTEKAATSISSQLFNLKDNKSLVTDFKQIQVKFREIGGSSHSSNLEIEITPEINKVNVYDKQFNEISSTVTPLGSKTRVVFTLDFLPNEEKYVNIVYEGNNTDFIEYTSNVTENNVTSVIVSEKEIFVLSQDRCSNLQSLNETESKNLFSFTENFRISNVCIYGPEPPKDASVIVKTIPVFIENIDDTIQAEKIKILVW